MRVGCTDRPIFRPNGAAVSWPIGAAVLRVVGALLILMTLVVPDLAAALGVESAPTDPRDSAHADLFDDIDGGACSDEELEELIDCGSDLEARIGEPLAIALLRTTQVRTTREQCKDLLADIWDRQSCSAEGRECGTMIPGGMPSPPPKLASSSSSAHAGLAALDLDGVELRRLGPPIDERMPKLRDLSPPVPPPKLGAH